MTTARGFEFPPAENGADYLRSVVEHLVNGPASPGPSPRDLKYAVLHLQAAAEVLLKVRLVREHWSLVFKDPGKATQEAFDSGDFISVTLEETLTRLRGIAGVELPDTARQAFVRLAKERNKLQHFGMGRQNSAAIEALVGRVLDALLTFAVDHLQSGAAPDEEQLFLQVRSEIERDVKRIGMLLNERKRRIGPALERDAHWIVTCPWCLEMALPVTGPRCLWCTAEATEHKETALAYWREVAAPRSDRWSHAPSGCPYCGDDGTLVGGVEVRGNPIALSWMCFSCGRSAGMSRLVPCQLCNAPTRIEDERTCQQCRGQTH